MFVKNLITHKDNICYQINNMLIMLYLIMEITQADVLQMEVIQYAKYFNNGLNKQNLNDFYLY